MNRLDGKTALITGAAASNGIGFATARAFAREGARLVLTDIDEAEIRKRASELVADGAIAIGLGHDVRSESAWNEVYRVTHSEYAGIDILVNNAGMSVVMPIEQATLAVFHDVFGTNVASVMLGCQGALKLFRQQERGGSIVNIASAAANIGIRNGSIYGASKGAVRMLTKCLSVELADERIRVNSVHPGMIRTNMFLGSLEEDAEALDIPVPWGSMGDPNDVAELVLFLASDQAKYITGGEYMVDGGLTAC